MSSAFCVLVSSDREQFVLPPGSLPQAPASSGVTVVDLPEHHTSTIKCLVSHLIVRHSHPDAAAVDQAWADSLQPAQYLEMTALSERLRLDWVTRLISGHIARQLRSPGLNWVKVEQMWKAMRA